MDNGITSVNANEREVFGSDIEQTIYQFFSIAKTSLSHTIRIFFVFVF